MPTPLPHDLTNTAFTVAAGRRAGLTRSRMRGLDLATPFPRVRMPSRWMTPLTAGATVADKIENKRRRVKALACSIMVRMPSRGVLAVTTAAYLHSIPLPLRLLDDNQVHVSVPRGTRAPVGKGITGHQVTGTVDDTTTVDDIPVTTLERTWCDLASVLDVPDLVAAGDWLIHHRDRHTTKRKLAAAARNYPTTRWRA